MLRRICIPAGLLLAATVLACDGEPLVDFGRTDGNSDKGYFQIEPLVNVAVGAKLDAAVRDYEGSDLPNPGRPKNATSSDPAVVAVEGIENGKITLAGKAPGPVTVSFQGVADQEAIDDSFKLEAIEAKRIELSTCTDGVYLRGAPAFLNYFFADGPTESAHKRAQGYGYYPLQVGDGGSVNTDHRDPFTIRVDVAEDAGDEVRVSSTLPDDPAEAILPLISPSEVTSVEVLLNGRQPATLVPGDAQPIGLRILAGDRLVCSVVEAEVVEETPDICQIARNDFDPMSLAMLGRAGSPLPVAYFGLATANLFLNVLKEGKCLLKFVILTASVAGNIGEVLLEVSAERPQSSGGGFDDD